MARAKDVLAYGLPISTDLALALVHEVQRLRAEGAEGVDTSCSTTSILDDYEAVKLPRGNADWRSVDWQPVTGWDLAAYQGQVHVDEADCEPLSPHEARALAAALLAAARYAEGKADDRP